MNNVEIQCIMHYESEGAYPDLSEHSDKLELHAVPEFDFDCRVEQWNTVEFKVLAVFDYSHQKIRETNYCFLNYNLKKRPLYCRNR